MPFDAEQCKEWVKDNALAFVIGYTLATGELHLNSTTGDIKLQDGGTDQITFDLDGGVLDSLLKASSVLSLPDMVLASDGTTVTLTVKDKKNATSNVFSKTVAQGTGSTYEMFLRMENIKLIPGDYTVFVSSKGIAQFTNKQQAVEYFIALEPDSTYNES